MDSAEKSGSHNEPLKIHFGAIEIHKIPDFQFGQPEIIEQLCFSRRHGRAGGSGPDQPFCLRAFSQRRAVKDDRPAKRNRKIQAALPGRIAEQQCEALRPGTGRSEGYT